MSTFTRLIVLLFALSMAMAAHGQDIITQWNFNSTTPDANTTTGTTSPSTGVGTASLVGGTTAAFTSGDVNGGSTDPATGDDSGWNITSFAAQGTGNKTRGVEFLVSTLGYNSIQVSWDQRHSNTAPRHIQFQYTTNGGTDWIDFGAPLAATAGDIWTNGRSVNLSTIPAANNNANFGIRIVATFDPASGTAYAASNSSSSYGTTGTWRFDMVTVSGTPLPARPDMRITEYLYSGTNEEFMEFTNTGTTPIDMTGWSYDDDSRLPGEFDLSAFGTVQPGESVIITEASIIAFRNAWNLCNEIKILNGYTNGIGRNDEINLYDASGQLVDRLTYGDQTFSGSIRTQNASGWVSAAGLGANDPFAWTLATVGDAENSYASSGNDIGSPGTSTRATVSFSPCLPPPAPQMRITEYLYSGVPGEFVEFTNTGTVPVDMTGWSYDDDSRTPGVLDLSAFGIVQPGQSVIITEAAEADFRAAWNLCDNIKIIDGYLNNLGRNDEINLYDAAGNLADRLTFGDQTFPGSIRTQNAAGWVSAAGLGANDAFAWTLATLGDAEGSYASTDNVIGSPGTSTRATVTFSACGPADMRITEYMYSGGNGEFVEFTNVGTTPINMAGWSYDDDGRTPGAFDLSAFGTVQPGESVIITETTPAAFRTSWNLCNEVKVLGEYDNNIGRNDEINLFDAGGKLVDRLTYGDQTFPGSIRTQNASGWVSAAGLGANDPFAWTLSTVGDAESSYASANGDIGSPGTSTRASVAFSPCTAVGDAPIIALNLDATNNFLDAGLTVSPNGSYAVSAVIADPTDPMSLYGLVFDISDADTDTDSLSVSVASSNETVAPQANISLTGGPAQYTLTVVPAAAGFSNITITVSDGNNTSSFIVLYAASTNGSTPASTRWHTQAADASAAVAIDAQYAFVADDEDQTIRLFDRTASGLPLAGFDFTDNLALPDGREVDIEGAFRLGDRIFWIGSHGNGSEAQNRPSRRRLFATDIAGTGANATLSYVGRYDGLREDLTAWGDANGYNFSATSTGTLPTDPVSLNIEGFTLAPDGSTAFIGFRAPRVPLPERGKALVAPILNFTTWFNNGNPAGSPTFGDPIELDLGGRAIRSMECNSNGCIIVAGNTDASGNFKLFTWSGEADATPQPRAADLSELTPEALVELPAGAFMGAAGTALSVQLISDNGTVDYYGNGQEAKDLAQDNHKKFRSDLVVLGDTELPAPSIVMEAADLDAECDGSGNTDELAEWLANNGGATAAVFCGEGVWTNQLTGTEGDCATYTFTITDECGKTATTAATFCIEDTTMPALACAPAATVTFNGEAALAIDFEALAFSSDICSESTLMFSTESVSCEQIGSIVPVLVTATDVAGNTATCTINIIVEGLPCGFSQNDDGINCNNGSDWSYDAAADVFTGTSTNCLYGSPYTKDQMAYTSRTLCGNGVITAQVTSINGSGWAGIVIRENGEANAKKAQLLTNLNAFNRREVRATTGGSSFPQNFTAQGRYWLRLVRQGNQIIGYASANGVNWVNVMAASLSMETCVEVGLIVTNSSPNSAVTATFANVSVEGASQLLAPVDMAGLSQDNTAQGSLRAYPNPSAGAVTLDVTAFMDQAATLTVQDALGRTLRTESLGTLRNTTEQIDLSGMPAGVYYLRLRLSGTEEHVQRIVVQPRP